MFDYCVTGVIFIFTLLMAWAFFVFDNIAAKIISACIASVLLIILIVMFIKGVIEIRREKKEENAKQKAIKARQIHIDFEYDECVKISEGLVTSEKNEKYVEEYYIKDLTLVPLESSKCPEECSDRILYAFVDNDNNPLLWLGRNTSRALYEAATKYKLEQVDYDFHELSLVFDTSRAPKDNSGKISFTLIEDWTDGIDFDAKGLLPREKDTANIVE